MSRNRNWGILQKILPLNLLVTRKENNNRQEKSEVDLCFANFFLKKTLLKFAFCCLLFEARIDAFIRYKNTE